MPKTKQQVVAQKIINTTEISNKIKKIDMKGIMYVALVLMAFIIGRLTQKVEDLQGGSLTNNTTTTAATTQPAAAAATKVTIDQIKGLWDKNIIKFGNADKKVLFVEVGDPSCPYCHVAGGLNGAINKQLNLTLVADGGTYVAPVPEMRKLIDKGQASFVYIYYPGHGNGEMAMKSLYCANEKGKFWQAHDLLMSNEAYNLINNTIKNDKAQSGAIATFLKSAVDPTFIKNCLDSGKYDARLGTDQTLVSTLGVQGTPGFFVNSTSYPGAYSWTDMKGTVDSALK